MREQVPDLDVPPAVGRELGPVPGYGRVDVGVTAVDEHERAVRLVTVLVTDQTLVRVFSSHSMVRSESRPDVVLVGHSRPTADRSGALRIGLGRGELASRSARARGARVGSPDHRPPAR